MTNTIRFTPNEPDDNHCFQACFVMATEALTGERLSMTEAEVLTNFRAGRPTWPYKGLLSFAERGLYVRYTENFSLHTFILKPETAIKEHVNDPEIADQVIRVSDLSAETKLAQACLDNPHVIIDERIPTLDDLKNEICSGALAIVNVNYFQLLNQPGYSGHFVVVEAIGEGSVSFQNPGLPPIPNQRTSIQGFLAAWHYPNDKLANIIAVRRSPFVIKSL